VLDILAVMAFTFLEGPGRATATFADGLLAPTTDNTYNENVACECINIIHSIINNNVLGGPL